VAVSDKPWSNFTQADYSPEQWRRACLVDTGIGDPTLKGRYKVPVREPDGTLNRNGVHAAAGGHGIGAVQGISTDTRRAAARKLVALYRNDLNEDPPESLLSLAGMRSGETGDAMAAVERRFTMLPVELRAGGSSPKIGGYAAVFESMSRNLGGFVEAVGRGFFNQSRSRGWPNVLARYNHDDNQLLGTTAAGTLQLGLDDVGLSYEVNPPRSRADVVELVQRGDVRQSSFAFIAENDEWRMSDDQNYPMRRLLQGVLVDVAPVNSPAYEATTAGLRSRDPHEVRRLSLGPDAAYASLAARMDTTIEEVREFADANELRKFFVRTDAAPAKPKPRAFGPAVAVQLLARRSDPWV